MLAGLPVAERRLRLAGTETAILEGGDGAPLVLLQGAIECGGAYWAPVIGELAPRFRLLVPDVPGLGESAPVDRLDADAFGRWFAALIEATCDQPPLVIAHSLLGSLAAAFAAGRSDLLRGICVYAAPGVGPYRIPWGLRVVAVRYSLRTNRRNAERFERFALLDRERTRQRSPGWFDSFSAYSHARAGVPHVKRTLNQLIRIATRQLPDSELGRIEAPVWLLWGRHDRMVPVEVARHARSRLGWPLEIVENAAHVPHIEQPPAFLEALEPALSDGAAQSPAAEVLR